MRLPTVHRHPQNAQSLNRRSSSNHDDFNLLAIIESESKTTTPEIALLLELCYSELKLHRQDASFYDMFSHSSSSCSVRNQLKCFCYVAHTCGGSVYEDDDETRRLFACFSQSVHHKISSIDEHNITLESIVVSALCKQSTRATGTDCHQGWKYFHAPAVEKSGRRRKIDLESSLNSMPKTGTTLMLFPFAISWWMRVRCLALFFFVYIFEPIIDQAPKVINMVTQDERRCHGVS